MNKYIMSPYCARATMIRKKILIRCERKLKVFSFDFYILGNKKNIDKLLADGGKEQINI